MRRPLSLATIVLALALGLTSLSGAAADTPELTLVGPTTPVRAGLPATFTATLKPGGAPLAGATVTLQQPAGTVRGQGVTDASGVARISAAVPSGATTFIAAYDAADPDPDLVSNPVTANGVRLPGTLRVTGPAGAVPNTRTLSLSWVTSDGRPVSAPVRVYRRSGADGRWVLDRTVTTDSRGLAHFGVAGRGTYAWQATGDAGLGWNAASSAVLETTRLPAVVLPRTAPRPRSTPAQSRGSGTGANGVITAIPNNVWATMVGRTWHSGCPVGRASLRLLRINYWGYDGIRYRGEMVLNAAVASRARGALTAMYDQGYPIRRMYREDRFGYSRRLHGANDYASMRADNSSAFNCRSVVNKPGVRSPHASGRAVDLNTWENPYRSRTGLVPNSWWASRTHPLVAWRSSSHPVVRIWRSWGFRWTYGTGDSQHVDGRRTATVSGTFSG